MESCNKKSRRDVGDVKRDMLCERFGPLHISFHSLALAQGNMVGKTLAWWIRFGRGMQGSFCRRRSILASWMVLSEAQDAWFVELPLFVFRLYLDLRSGARETNRDSQKARHCQHFLVLGLRKEATRDTSNFRQTTEQ